jgi:hypothetical protein
MASLLPTTSLKASLSMPYSTGLARVVSMPLSSDSVYPTETTTLRSGKMSWDRFYEALF